MPGDLSKVLLYHITSVHNLPGIIRDGVLYSDAEMVGRGHSVSGYSNIKQRRLTQIRVDSCGGRYVGEFVPFYYCPRSPMLYTLNQGNVPGKPAGCQREIVHLVTSVDRMIALGQRWAISNGNAGSFVADFSSELDALDTLKWEIINSNQWGGTRIHFKQAEFLVADRVPWSSIRGVGCYNSEVASMAKDFIGGAATPVVVIKPGWYY